MTAIIQREAGRCVLDGRGNVYFGPEVRQEPGDGYAGGSALRFRGRMPPGLPGMEPIRIADVEQVERIGVTLLDEVEPYTLSPDGRLVRNVVSRNTYARGPGGLAWWYFRDGVYVTAERDLEATDVEALLTEAENRKRLRLARARELRELASRLEQDRPPTG